MNQKFHYKLQSVLNVRESMKKSCEMELAAANRALRDEEERLRKVAERIYAALNPGAELVQDIPYFNQRERHLRTLRVELESRKNAVKMATMNVNNARQKLLEAHVEVKKFEKNREREKDLWTAELGRLEQSANDEISNVLAYFKATDRI